MLGHLREHLGFLQASSASFDGGFHGEAKRLALTIRVLLHDTNSSKSLLGQLEYKFKMGFLDTARDANPKNLISHHGLVSLQVGGGKGRYHAQLDGNFPGTPNRYVFFRDWWNKVVIVDSKKVQFTRRDLVLALANQDGGGHVDPALDEKYANLSRNNSVGWRYSNGVIETPFEGVELFSVRQIAFEVYKSIDRQLAKVKLPVLKLEKEI